MDKQQITNNQLLITKKDETVKNEDEFSLKELKLAVINKDLKKLEELSKKNPFFSSIKEAKEFLGYLHEAIKILEKSKNKLSNDMKEIKKLQKFYLNNSNDSFNLKV